MTLAGDTAVREVAGEEAFPPLQERLREALRQPGVPAAPPSQVLRSLVSQQLDRLPLPGQGRTLDRWRTLYAVAREDLSLVKLYEGHTDALAILAELGADPGPSARTWGTWAAEAPDGRVVVEPTGHGAARLRGRKRWCSGAADVDAGLLTAWHEDGRGPQLVAVDMNQASVSVDAASWRAVGMGPSASIDVTFDGTPARLVGGVGDYLNRPGFWQGGAGIAACWLGGAAGLSDALRAKATQAAGHASPYVLSALGEVDATMAASLALLRETAAWIDGHASANAMLPAMRTRLAIESACDRVVTLVGRALGATPYCRDDRHARLAADLPVFLRQSHGDKDAAGLAEVFIGSKAKGDSWMP